MARILAVEWDTREARVAALQTRGLRVALEHAFAVPLGDKPDGDGAAQVGARIRAALAERRIGKSNALIAVGRANIELKQLSLPPAPDDELPDLVRFQAQREFNSLGEDSPLDFVPLTTDPTAPRQVLAAAISSDLVKGIRATCAAAELKPTRLVLRPCATASLLCRRRAPKADVARLLVDLLADEADLTVLVGEQVVFLRTVRLPSEVLGTAEEYRPLLAEIRRTIGAAQNQLGGRKIEGLDLCGRGDEHAALVQRLQAELSLPVASFDPLGELEIEPGLSLDLPAHPGRFAPLVGMLLDEAAKKAPAIDFLQPRRRPEAASRRPMVTRVALIAALALLTVGVGIWFQLDQLDSQILTLTRRLNEAKRELQAEAAIETKAKTIDQWTAAEVIWLDELEELAAEYPPSQNAVLTKLSLKRTAKVSSRGKQASDGSAGEIAIDGVVRDAADVGNLASALADDHHKIKPGDRKRDDKMPPYKWTFGSTIVVKAQDKTQYQKRAQSRPTKSAAAAAEAPAAPIPATPTPAAEKGAPASPESTPAESPPAESTPPVPATTAAAAATSALPKR